MYIFELFSARAEMQKLVWDLIRKRHQDTEKAEKLFIDSMLDNDFMDEEEVTNLTLYLMTITSR